MTLRTSRYDLTFRAPFTLKGEDGVHPPGTYVVETEEELVEELSFTAYRRVATSIMIPLPGSGGGSYQKISTDPSALEAAQSRDQSP